MGVIQGLGLAKTAIANPHNVPDARDRILPVKRGVAGYSETAFLATWNPDTHVGLFVHAGRCPQDVDLWWAQAIVYLPGGALAVDRSWGRFNDGAMKTGCFTLRMDHPRQGWSSTFDGAGEITTIEGLASGIVGSGAARPLRWEFVTEAAGPMWDLYALLGDNADRQAWTQGTHTEQALKIFGSVSVDGVEYSLDGHGCNDHSSGPRDISTLGSHHLLIGSLPGRSLHLLTTRALDDTPLMSGGTEFREDGLTQNITLTDVPRVTSLKEAAGPFRATLTDDNGTTSQLQVEPLHTAVVSMTNENDNINGVDPADKRDLHVLFESPVRLTTDAGEVGYAHLERSARLSRLTSA